MAIRITPKLATLAAGMVIAAVALTGCTLNIGSPAAPSADSDSNSMDHMMGHNHMMDSSAGPSGAAGYASQDLMFAQMMIPHHEQAVLMANFALKASTNREVLTLAKQIKDAQQPEINQMTEWLTAAGVNANGDTDMGNMGGMDGMLSTAEINTLFQATGTQFDKLFLSGMIAHHQGAIKMAAMIVDSKNSEVSKLGNAIISSQTKEIAYMQQLLKGLN